MLVGAVEGFVQEHTAFAAVGEHIEVAVAEGLAEEGTVVAEGSERIAVAVAADRDHLDKSDRESPVVADRRLPAGVDYCCNTVAADRNKAAAAAAYWALNTWVVAEHCTRLAAAETAAAGCRRTWDSHPLQESSHNRAGCSLHIHCSPRCLRTLLVAAAVAACLLCKSMINLNKRKGKDEAD